MVKKQGSFVKPGVRDIPVPAALMHLDDGPCTLGFRPHNLSLAAGDGTTPLSARVMVTEITGSESYVHLVHEDRKWVMLTKGIHRHRRRRKELEVHLDTRHLSGVRPRRTHGSPPGRLGHERTTMARIDLDHIRHALHGKPRPRCGLCAARGASLLGRWRRLRSARAFGLRQEPRCSTSFQAC